MDEIYKLRKRVKTLESWILALCDCPCCGRVKKCMKDCTFAADCPEDNEAMMAARHVLYGDG